MILDKMYIKYEVIHLFWTYSILMCLFPNIAEGFNVTEFPTR